MEETNGATKQHINNGKGGCLSSLLILGTSLGINIASGAWSCNLIVFLISVFNVKNIPAAQIYNIISGFTSFFPFIAAIFADSAFGAFSVTLISSIVSLLGVLMFTFLLTIKSLRPPPCPLNSSPCVPPTTFQNSFLYISLTLASLGLGGTRFLLGTMAADQLDKPKHQSNVFNWFVFTVYVGFIIGYTLLIYIQTSVSWALSFFIALAANVIAVALFVIGSRMYRKLPPQGSPFTSIARVFIAAFRNMKMVDEDGYLYESMHSKLSHGEPSKCLGFFNRAALIKQGNNQAGDTNHKSWSQCTVEEVEDLKKLIKIMPLWSSSILLSAAIGIIMSFTVLLALVMDRSVGSHYKIPPGSFVVVTFVFTAITSPTINRIICPAYEKLTGRRLTFLPSIGVGHVCNILAVIAFALIERRRLKLIEVYHLTDQQNAVAPLSALWLIVPLAITGIGEGFSFSPEVALYYQEFPRSLRSTSTAMISLHIAAGFYLSSAFINLVGRTSSWLPNDINHGRADKACWALAIVITVNFAYFCLCARLYKYNNPDSTTDNGKIISN